MENIEVYEWLEDEVDLLGIEGYIMELFDILPVRNVTGFDCE